MELLNDLLDTTGNSDDGFVNVGSNGGLTIWYTGAANQTAHGTATCVFNNIFAYPVVLPGGVIDTVAFEVTTNTALSTGRCGIYTNTSEQILYPANLVVDGGDIDTHTAAGVKSTAVNVTIPPGLYWFVTTAGTASPVLRAIAVGGQTHVLGLPVAMGAGLVGRLDKAIAYGALPATYPTGAVQAAASICGLVAVHFSA